MTEPGSSLLIPLFLLNLSLLLLFAAHAYVVILRFFKGSHRRSQSQEGPLLDYPNVLVQLPIYNEQSSVVPLLDAIRLADYPHSHLHIQILDDSDDGTTKVIENYLKNQTSEFRFAHIRRSSRREFKAGALKFGMELNDSPFIVIFDADFRPDRTYIRKAVERIIAQPQVGLIQGRWTYTNETSSLWTRFQGIGMDGHFAIEQPARAWNDFFMNFNGTAGIFRRSAILDAGNWQGDTLTEDLDLSYRAQLAGWKFDYAFDLPCASEIPETVFAFKSQQFRWAKGSVQTLLKIYPRILGSKVSMGRKIEAGFHLAHYLIHPMLLLNFIIGSLFLLNPEVLEHQPVEYFFLPILFASLGPSLLYQVSQNELGKKVPGGILFYPLMISLGCAMAMNNTRAIFQAICRIKSPFVRTPKKGNLSKEYRPVTNYYFLLELLLACLGIYALSNTNSDLWLLIPFISMYTVGFLTLGLTSSIEWFHEILAAFSIGNIPFFRSMISTAKLNP